MPLLKYNSRLLAMNSDPPQNRTVYSDQCKEDPQSHHKVLEQTSQLTILRPVGPSPQIIGNEHDEPKEKERSRS